MIKKTMKMPAVEMARAARQAYQIHIETGLDEIRVPYLPDLSTLPQPVDEFSRNDWSYVDCWVFEFEFGQLNCVAIPKKYMEVQ